MRKSPQSTRRWASRSIRANESSRLMLLVITASIAWILFSSSAAIASSRVCLTSKPSAPRAAPPTAPRRALARPPPDTPRRQPHHPGLGERGILPQRPLPPPNQRARPEQPQHSQRPPGPAGVHEAPRPRRDPPADGERPTV